jgi:hypothetical protein
MSTTDPVSKDPDGGSQPTAQPEKGIWQDEAAATEATEESTGAEDQPDEDS